MSIESPGWEGWEWQGPGVPTATQVPVLLVLVQVDHGKQANGGREITSRGGADAGQGSGGYDEYPFHSMVMGRKRSSDWAGRTLTTARDGWSLLQRRRGRARCATYACRSVRVI